MYQKYNDSLLNKKEGCSDMFEIGFISDMVSMDFEEALKSTKAMGINYLEIHALWGKNVEELTNDEVNKVKKLLDKFEIKVSIISSTLFIQCPLFGDETEFDEFDDYFLTYHGDFDAHIHALERCIAMCDSFKTRKIRIFGFRKKKDIEQENAVSMVSEKLNRPLNIAETHGVELVLENCPHTYIQSGSSSAQVIDQLGSKYIRSLWDPGNAFRRGFQPFPDDYNGVKKYISHMHAKDYVPSGKELAVPFGEGTINYKGILMSLINDKFEGVFSLEPEYISKEGGRIGSNRECLSGLLKMKKELSIS